MIQFEYEGVKFGVTSVVKPTDAARHAGVAFNFGLSVLDKNGRKLVNLNSLGLIKSETAPGGWSISSPRRAFQGGSINAVIFTPNRQDPVQNELYLGFLRSLIPALKAQFATPREPRNSTPNNPIGEDFYAQSASSNKEDVTEGGVDLGDLGV